MISLTTKFSFFSYLLWYYIIFLHRTHKIYKLINTRILYKKFGRRYSSKKKRQHKKIGYPDFFPRPLCMLSKFVTNLQILSLKISTKIRWKKWRVISPPHVGNVVAPAVVTIARQPLDINLNFNSLCQQHTQYDTSHPAVLFSLQ